MNSQIDEVLPQSSLGASRIGGFETVYLSGSVGFPIVGAISYHIEADSMPARYAVLRRTISVAIWVLRRDGRLDITTMHPQYQEMGIIKVGYLGGDHGIEMSRSDEIPPSGILIYRGDTCFLEHATLPLIRSKLLGITTTCLQCQINYAVGTNER